MTENSRWCRSCICSQTQTWRPKNRNLQTTFSIITSQVTVSWFHSFSHMRKLSRIYCLSRLSQQSSEHCLHSKLCSIETATMKMEVMERCSILLDTMLMRREDLGQKIQFLETFLLRLLRMSHITPTCRPLASDALQRCCNAILRNCNAIFDFQITLL